MRAKILVVDDNQLLRDSLRFSLERDNYQAATASTGEEALEKARIDPPDLVLLDIGLPGMDGLEVCQRLQKEIGVPVIMLTARDREMDKVVGLHVGADDYVSKPFSTPELLARIRAVLRRTARGEISARRGGPIVAGDIRIDEGTHQVTVGERPVRLSPKEFELLLFLARNHGKVVRREHLLDAVWGEGWVGETKTLDVHMQWLRQKMQDATGRRDYIETVRGVGYKLVAESSDA